jgi:hypothetical protein
MKEESAKHDTVRMAPSYRPHTIGGFARSYRFALSSYCARTVSYRQHGACSRTTRTGAYRGTVRCEGSLSSKGKR